MSTATVPLTSLPTDAPTRLVTGLTASGRLHIGNYVGAVRPLLDLAASGTTQAVCFVADLHAMTTDHDPGRLREHTRELAATLLACGLGDDATLFLQSAVPAHTELAYLLECTAAYGEMTRMIQFKEKAGRERGAARLSLLTYPALMAADILLYRADVVPVGDDQRQHLELTRTLARRFNARYGDVFTVPSSAVPPAAARLRDLRVPTAKMGKSTSSKAGGSGIIHLLDDPVRIAATGSDPAVLAAKYTQYGPLKADTADAVVALLEPIQARYAELMADPAGTAAVLAKGAAKAQSAAAPTLARAQQHIGLLPRS